MRPGSSVRHRTQSGVDAPIEREMGTRLALYTSFELARGTFRMDMAALTRMQIRVVLTVFRAEMARLERVDPLAASFGVGRLLRVRSMELLDTARARLNGKGSSHPELLAELDLAREEVAGGLRPEISAGSHGGRRG